ncbi:ATP-dependent 6-phosphofructokinase [Candidatus Peregrinibacteria bacterium]|nr:ATP-dependent 6-phosphofructokinase [Candidatus Peregrinibacteria bacterium]
MPKKIGIVNGGGDCAGLNAVIEGIVRSGSKLGYEFLGFRKSFEGVLDADYKQLKAEEVEDISRKGGTILRTTNKGRFAAKVGDGEDKQIPEEILDKTKNVLNNLDIDCTIVIGGDGTLSGALQLQERKNVNIVGVPKTIDNDLMGTDKTFGFSSAVDFVVNALDKIHTTAESHSRVFIVETMGRHAGWIALYGGVGGGADIILIPEIEFNYEKLIESLRSHQNQKRGYSLIVAAEGAKSHSGDLSVIDAGTGKECVLGGIANEIMNEINNRTDNEFEIRTTVLGHLQRGGSPNAEDRNLALRYGAAAIKAVSEGKYGQMVRIKGNQISTVSISKAVEKLNLVTKDNELYKAAQSLGINFGE